MPSNHLHPLYIRYVHNLLLGVSSFVVLCSFKMMQVAHQDMSKQVTRSRVTWSVEETDKLLDLLIARRENMSQSWTFSNNVLGQVADELGADKGISNVKNKFRVLKKVYRAILNYSNSGHVWSETQGANIDESSPEALEAWKHYLTHSFDGKELTHYRNQAWPWYQRMAKLTTGHSGATVIEGLLSNPDDNEEEEVLSDDDDEDALFADGALNNDHIWMSQPPEIQLDMCQLINIAKNVTSLDLDTQMGAVHEALSFINRLRTHPTACSSQAASRPASPAVSPASSLPRVLSSESSRRTYSDSFSFRPHTISSKTTPISSINAPKSRSYARDVAAATPIQVLRPPSARTAATSHSGASSRRRGAYTESNMASAVALTAMKGVLSEVTDCMKDIRGKLSTPPPTAGLALPAAEAPLFLPPQFLPPQPSTYRAQALHHLNNDTKLNRKIRSALALELSRNSGMCEVYAGLVDPTTRMDAARDWFNDTHPHSRIATPPLPELNIPPDTHHSTYSFNSDARVATLPFYSPAAATPSYLTAANDSSSYLFAGANPEGPTTYSDPVAGKMRAVHEDVGDRMMGDTDHSMHHDNAFYDNSFQ